MVPLACPAKLSARPPGAGPTRVARGNMNSKSASIDLDLGTSSKEAIAVDVLNALTASIAVLDHSGVIIAVNDAWTRFARENDGGDAAGYLGSNYLAACEAAIRDADPIADAVSAAFRALRSGNQDQFTIEYPCHSPTTERWFEMRMTRSPRRPHYIVVAHEDITSRKRMEAELKGAKQSIESFNAQLQEALAREQQYARTDELTGINNRRHFFALARQAFTIGVRYRHPISVVLLDLDHFKEINDRWGHQVGDEVLRHVANIAQRHLRSADILGRYGGEEFIVLLPDSTAEQSKVVAERIREEIETGSLETPKGYVALTVSAGIADTASGGDESIERLIGFADLAMYAAKQAGRNRTSLHSGGSAT
jgi:diguanylate cyclase (GGDEF)-like protein